MIPEELLKIYRKQGYKIVGKYGAVKLCTWLKKSIKNEGFCYKQKFYGIESHRCLQFTPCLTFCTQQCIYCWRSFQGTETFMKEWDDPKLLVEESIKAQRELIIGFKGYKGTDLKKFEEAMNPKHAAISLAGEPTLYPEIDELIEEFHKRNMTTFLVSNGTMPEVLERMKNLPTQLYISVSAPSEEVYRKVCRPLLKDGWQRLNRSLEIFRTLKTRRVIRLTLVRELNMIDPKGFSKLIEKADPDFVECKAFMSVGFARKRLPYESMPLHEEIFKFAEELCEELNYKIIDEKRDSRVVLIGKSERGVKIN
ncbi:MAG TPA: 4-demethylwyosine synthase TYW1 [Candidatus Aenigmarchaeota archaeon]|nr:4-demethylwyosine synthase TYW1 [Candidatus Aenigmarchaeota archaeon]